MNTVAVSPVVVVYALRYALPRLSGALSDVVPAVKAAWPAMDEGLRVATRRDVEDALHLLSGTALEVPEREAMVELLGWLDDGE